MLQTPSLSPPPGGRCWACCVPGAFLVLFCIFHVLLPLRVDVMFSLPHAMDQEAEMEVHPDPIPHLPPPTPSSETGSAGLGRRISAHQPRLLAPRGGEEPALRGCAPGQGAPGAGGPRLELQRVRELQRGLGRGGQARGRAHQASSVLPAQGEGRGHLSPQPRAPESQAVRARAETRGSASVTPGSVVREGAGALVS